MRRAVAPLLLAIAIVSPLVAEGHPSTAVHRIVGKKLFEEIAAHSVGRAAVALSNRRGQPFERAAAIRRAGRAAAPHAGPQAAR